MQLQWLFTEIHRIQRNYKRLLLKVLPIYLSLSVILLTSLECLLTMCHGQFKNWIESETLQAGSWNI